MPAAIPLDETALLALHDAGKSTRQIATLMGNVAWCTVARRLKRLTPRKSTEIYKTLRADVLAEKQRQLLMCSHGATPKEQRDIATAVGIYYDKERLERGQATEISAMDVRMLVQSVQIQARVATDSAAGAGVIDVDVQDD